MPQLDTVLELERTRSLSDSARQDCYRAHSVRMVPPIALSPDGRHLAYSVDSGETSASPRTVFDVEVDSQRVLGTSGEAAGLDPLSLQLGWCANYGSELARRTLRLLLGRVTGAVP